MHWCPGVRVRLSKKVKTSISLYTDSQNDSTGKPFVIKDINYKPKKFYETDLRFR